MQQISPTSYASVAELRIAAAILVTPDRRYLMQLRDDKPGLRLAGHWALFGGGIEDDETPAEALVRELGEELEFAPRTVHGFTEASYVLPRVQAPVMRLAFFVVPITPADVAGMVQHEGADKRLFRIDDLVREPRVAPWDLAAVMMHARHDALFPDEGAPATRA